MPRPHFIGSEASASPVVPDLLEAAKALAKAGVTTGTVSARYGKRTVVNTAGVPLDQMTDAHFVEVADYDPHTDQVLCLGSHAPAPDAGLHALVYRAKSEVWAIVRATLPADAPGLRDLPEPGKSRTTLDDAMSVLERLRDADAARLGERDVLVTARSPRDAVARVNALAGGGP